MQLEIKSKAYECVKHFKLLYFVKTAMDLSFFFCIVLIMFTRPTQ